MAAPGMQGSTPLVLLNAVTVTATGNSATFSLPQAECYALYLYASAASGTTPSVAAVLQTGLDGQANTGSAPAVPPTVWVNTGVAFAPVTTAGAAGSNGVTFRPTLGLGEASGPITVTPGTASAKGQPIRREFCRLSFTVTGTAPSVTLSLYALTNPKGYSGI